jgi:hypothetical protein
LKLFSPRRLVVTVLLAAIAVGTLLGLRAQPAQGIPIPPLTYSIIAVSGTHHASLLNLPVGQPGTYEAPIPVDVNGDLLPDVLVSVNLVNVNGVFHNPPDLGAIIAPNIQIDRMITAPVLGQPSPPLKIEVQLKVSDTSGGPGTTLAFGYDTGVGGTIPTYYHALVGGLDTFFNPLQAVVDTTGTVVGLQPNINALGLAPVAAPYQGPLHVIGNLSTGSTTANLDFGFRPFPRTVTVGYSTDSAGQHVTYADSYGGQVDLSGGIQITNGASTTNLNTRIDRLPQNLAIDFNNGTAANSGSVDFTSTPNGRLPDVGLTLATTAPGARPLNANISIDALPAVMHADWSLPPAGPAQASFCAPAAPSPTPCTAPQGAGIGSIQAQVTNYAPGGSPLVPYVPDQQQFLNFQQGGKNPSDPDMLITARVERIRLLHFSQSATGIDATAQLGDGELPLLAHFVTDGRGGSAPGPYTEATATVSPLPSSAHLNFQLPPPGATNPPPTVLTYNASSPVDITGNFTSFGTTSGGACGLNGTICATLQAFHIPSQVITTITDQPDSTQINVDSTSPGASAADEPDFIADATLGQSDDAHPIVAHAQLLGFPKAVTIYTHEGVNQTLDAAEFHACDWNVGASPPACVPGQTEGNVGSLSFDIHDWLNRPANLPQSTPTTPNFADVVARGVSSPATNQEVNFEATGQVKAISELDYRNVGGVDGVRVHAGGGLGFSAHVDADNILPSAGSDRFTAVADAVVPSLPSQFDVCFRQPDRTLDTTGASFTTPCEDTNPFGDANPLTTSPLTFSYRANSNFDVLTSGKVVDEGADSAANGSDTSVSDDRTYQGTLNVTNLPQNLTANLAMPPSGSSGAIRALYCSGSVLPTGSSTCPSAAAGDPQVNVDFAASATDADLVCKDPRLPASGDVALCAQGTLANLPSHALVTYDPTQPTNNLDITTSGDKQMSLGGTAPCAWGSATPTGTTIAAGSPQCFEVSSVSRDDTAKPAQPKVLIADGNIADVPRSVTGTLFFPDGGSPDVDVTATPALGHVDAVVRNFIAPNPILQSVPDRSTGFGAPTQEVSFFQRGSAFEGEAHIGDVSGFGFRTVSDASGTPLDTQVIRAQFGGNQVIRAYADIEPSDADRIIGDVTLNNVPAGLNLCLRGADTHTSPTPVAGWDNVNGTYVDPPGPGQGTFCDNGDSTIPVSPDDGSFQFSGTPASGSPPGLGVDAFVRQSTGGNSNILSGRVHIDGIPDVVEGTFPSSSTKGDLDVGGFAHCSTTGPPACGAGQHDGDLVPSGIQHISVNLASFDIDPADAGWTGTVPYAPLQNHNAPFPVVVPTDGHQYLEAILHDSAIQLRGDIGPDSQLQQVEMLQQACAAPSNNPPDYPAFPTTVNGTTVKYKCIEGNFVQHVPNAPLDVGFLDQTPDGQQISFNGGLTDLPHHIQMTLSDTGGQNDSSLQPCGPAGSSVSSNCVPPLVRFDQPANSTLFGNLQYGSTSDLAKLATVSPVEKFVNVSAVPDPSSSTNPWNDWVEPSNPSGNGLRAKLGINKGNISADVGLQLAVPQSLTIDQPLGWSQSVSSDQQDYWQASDTKIHFIVRDAAGNPVGSLGEGAVLLNDFDDAFQLLGGNPCTSVPLALRGSDPQSCPDFGFGFPVPGELGVAMYRRDNTGQGKDYMQIDGRVSQGSAPLNIGVRLLATGEQAPLGRLEGQILDVPTTSDVSGLGPNDPSFRLQEEMVGNGSAPPTGGQNPTPQGEQTQSVCSSAFFCAQVDVKIASVFAKFDFKPSSARPARLVQAVIDQVGSTKQGMEVAGFSGLTDSSSPAPVTADGFVDINPLNIYIDAGIPLLAGADLALQSEIQATFGINDSTDFYVRENLLHIETASQDQDSSNPSQVGPLNVYIYLLHAEADLLFVPLLTIDFVPTSIGPADSDPGPPSGPAQLATVDCSNFATAIATGIADPDLANNTITPSTDLNNPSNTLIWPFGPNEPRFILGGVLGPVFDVLQHFASPFFCLAGAGADDIPLRGGAASFPSDPVGGLSTSPPATTPLVDAAHPIPGETLDPTITPATPPPAVPPTQTAQNPTPVTISTPVALCGEHDFGQLTISAKVSVATSVPSPNPDYQGSGLMCPAGSEGTLTIVTPGHKVTITSGGSIDASGVVTGQQPLPLPSGDSGPGSVATGNGGGGHGGGGGAGTTGSGGSSFGNTSNGDPTTESGVAGSGVGGGGAAGHGGGVISVLADTVVVDSGGSIVANGTGGANGSANCSGSDTAGGGGGSGGGISISAVEVDNNGAIAANGGGGGSSGISPGGGGGGGIVKLIAPIVTGNAVQSGGAGAGGIPGAGTGSCPASTGVGGGSGFGSSPFSTTSSQASPVLASDGTPKFWNQENTNSATASQPDLPAPLSVPYQSASSSGASGSLQTYLCAAYLSTTDYQAAKTAHPNDTLDQLFTLPPLQPGKYPVFGPLVEVDPCGAASNGFGFTSGSAITLGQTSYNQNRVNGTFTVGDYSNGTSNLLGAFTGPELTDGYYGLYTVAATPNTANKSCSDPSNDCSFEVLPGSVQTVIGIDNGPPALGFTVNGSTGGFETANQKVQLNITASGNQQLSGLAEVQCANDGVKFTDCGPQGPYQWALSNGDGSKTVSVEAVNGAGAVTEQQVTGLFDTTAPTVSKTLSGGVLVNGWYQVPPSITLHGSDATTGLNSAEAFAYRFDDGSEHPMGTDPTCPGPNPNPITTVPLVPDLSAASCTIPQSIINNLSDGSHTLYFTAIDAVGNRLGPDDDQGNPESGAQPMASFTLKIDHERPSSALLSVPAAPDGNNGWYATRPWVVISAIDQVGGSGLVPSGGDSPVAGVSYYLDGTLHAAPAAPNPPLGPFQLTDGAHDVCWFAQDRAGNFDVSGSGGADPTTAQLAAVHQCQHFNVDSQAPSSVITLAPTAPNGSGGWYTSPVPLTVTSTDPAPGSGVALVDPSQLCGAPTTPSAGASGTCVSIDHAAFEPYLSTFTIPEGTHDVRAFSVDAAGNRSAMVDQPINVDLSPPVASAVLVPGASAQNGWWRSAPYPGDQPDSPPQVVLRAVDGAQNSGVAHLQYQINPTASPPPAGAWVEYKGPFNVPQGVNTVVYRAIDAAGLIEPTQTLLLPVDVTPPVVAATSPKPALWLQLLSILGNILGLSPANDQLQWTVSDNLSAHVHITVLVFNVAGAVVRQLDGGTYATTPGVTLSGSTPWDGRDYTITGLVPVGLYYYRVVATDDAGNIAQSGESSPLTIKVSL